MMELIEKNEELKKSLLFIAAVETISGTAVELQRDHRSCRRLPFYFLFKLDPDLRAFQWV